MLSVTDVDHRDHEALVALAPGSGQLVGVARFIRNPREPDQAEVAVTVIDSWQRRGLGAALLRELAQRAAEEGIRHFTAEILAENRPMLTPGPQARARRDHLSRKRGVGLDRPRGDRAGGHLRPRPAARRGARGEFIGLPAVLRGSLDLSEKIIATLLVPVSAFHDASRQAATTPAEPLAAARGYATLSW